MRAASEPLQYHWELKVTLHSIDRSPDLIPASCLTIVAGSRNELISRFKGFSCKQVESMRCDIVSITIN